MSRAVLAKAVLKNVLHYFDNTKSLRKGSVISCRNFLLRVCFHKQSFSQGTYSLRNISELTKIDRRVMSTHMKSKEVLKNIRYKAFATTSPSNYWGKRAVTIFVKTLYALPVNFLVMFSPLLCDLYSFALFVCN